MKNTLETRLGVFFALAVIAAVILLQLVGGLDLLRSGYRVKALFDTVQELKIGDPVKMAGVQIGRVEEIELATIDPTNTQVRVTMKINMDRTIRTDSKATIKFTGLMGQNFVAIDPGKGDRVEPGADTYLKTVEQPDLSAMMANVNKVLVGVKNVTDTFSGAKLDDLIGPLISFVEHESPKLSNILSHVQIISGQIARGEGTVGELIMTNTLHSAALSAVTNFEATAGEITLAASKVSGLLDQVQAGEGTVGQLVTDKTLYVEATTAMTNLREILEKVNRGQGFAGQVVNDTNLFKNVRMTLQKLEKATEGLEDQGPLTVLGIAINPLF